MQSVSELWKNNQEQGFIDKQALLNITFKVVDSSQKDTTVVANDRVDYCSPNDIKGDDYKIKRYATLERNFWLLDGSRDILDRLDIAKANTGFISNKLNDFNFVRLVGFDMNYTTKRFSIKFGEFNCAKHFTVLFIDDNGNAIKRVEIQDNTKTEFDYIMDEQVSGYKEVFFNFQSIAIPDQVLRVESITIGVVKKYTNKDIISYSMNSSVSILNDNLPINEINFELDNTDNMFNPDNPNGFFAYLSKRQEIKVQYGYALYGGDEFVDGGTYYLTEWETPQNYLTATFKAKNILNFFDKSYIRGISGGVQVKFALEDIFTQMNWSLSKTYIDSFLSSVYIHAPIPVCSCVEAIQYIAQICNCVVYVDKQNIINVRHIDIDIIHNDYVVSNFKEYKYPELEIYDEISSFDVNVYNYYEDNQLSELFKSELEVGTYTVLYDMVSDNGIVISGDTTPILKLSFSSNFTVNTQGLITISGYKLNASSHIYSLDNETNGSPLEIDNPLITNEDEASSVANHLHYWGNKRYIDNVNFRIDPRLDLLDIIPVESKLSTNNGIVESIKIDYNGAFKGSIKVRRI